MNLYHITLAAEGRRRLFPDEASIRTAVRRIARVAGTELALFNLVDDHRHFVTRAIATAPAGSGRR